MGNKFLFIINPIAGGKKKQDVPTLLKEFCNTYSCAPLFYFTTGNTAKDLEQIKSHIKSHQPNAVVAVGGDGTVNLVGEVLVKSDLPLGILPMGSSNGLSRDLNIPQDFDDALHVLQDFHLQSIDTLKVNGRNCFHISDFGFNARVCSRFSESLMRGKISYVWYGLQEFFSFNPFQYTIQTEHQNIEGRAFMMTVTNSNRFGTNVNINPLGEIDDGFFEISIIKPFPKYQSLKILYYLLSNSIHKSTYNRVIRARKAVIFNQERTSFHIDGEPVTLGEKVEIEIVPKGLKVITPVNS
jgi:YegS/Rv2252/BmrU family lipid kinase